MEKKILCIFGTRPETIKMAPVVKTLSRAFDLKVCVTAQHRHMLDQVLDTFGIKPDHDLNIMEQGQTLYHITCACIERLSPVLGKENPDLVLVHGDTTTTFAGALAAYYRKIPVGHVEAGLRSYDKFNPYPEEINRVLTDRLCELMFAPTDGARKNLLREGEPPGKIFVTGNTVIDALQMALKVKHKTADPALKTALKKASGKRIILVTAHRRENFGRPLRDICSALRAVADQNKDVAVFYPVHLNPNVRAVAGKILSNHPRIFLLEPLEYMDFINLMKMSYIVVTDSGGLQEEAPALGKPVLVLRKVTERPEAVEAGTAKVIGTDKNNIIRQISILLRNPSAYKRMAKAKNPYGDGKASERILKAIRSFL
jgi:UDP-N-acetylglucosamine 2-epimerase